MKIQSRADIEEISREYINEIYSPDYVKVNIGMASCGIAAGAKASYDRGMQDFKDSKSVKICQTGCIGFCEEEPLVEIFGKWKSQNRLQKDHGREDRGGYSGTSGEKF